MQITKHIQSLIQLALSEDIGRGDATTELLIDAHLQATALLFIKQSARVAGLPVVEAVFRELDPTVKVTRLVAEGADVTGKTAVCELRGNARSILTGERTALNFLARLSGIATKTRDAVQELEGTRTKLLDTRKTTPGWRELEKYAVRTGGGYNHRFGLDDMILIKDNHIALAGGVKEAVMRARSGSALSLKIEVEVDTLEQLETALECGPDMILLDNMNDAELSRAVQITNGRVPLEASGNMTIERLRSVAQTGVDYISMGALTHSAVSVDVGLDITFETH
jgi:nicotinate-nucleotide pyrophosphorylase (carboxylating)